MWLWEWRGCRLEYEKGIDLWFQCLSFTLVSARLILGPENPTLWILSQSPHSAHTPPPITHCRSPRLWRGSPWAQNSPTLTLHPERSFIPFLADVSLTLLSALKFPQKHSLVIFPNHSNYLITLILIDFTWHQGVN